MDETCNNNDPKKLQTNKNELKKMTERFSNQLTVQK